MKHLPKLQMYILYIGAFLEICVLYMHAQYYNKSASWLN